MSDEEQWFAGSKGSEYLSYGPYPTAGEAIKASMEDSDPGDIIEYGVLVIHVPHIDPYRITERLIEHEGVVGGKSDTWLTDITPEQYDDLGARLDAALMDWLISIDQVPDFGWIEKLQEYVVTEQDV